MQTIGLMSVESERSQLRLDQLSLLASDDAVYDARNAMRTTVTIDDDLMEQAEALTGIEERSALLREGLRTLIRVESARRLAALAGSDHNAAVPPRSREHTS